MSLLKFKRMFVVGSVLLLVVSACGDDDAGETSTTAAATTTEAPATTSAPTTAAPTTAAPLTGDAVQGGKLYDKWWKALEIEEPTGDNPLWARQATNERSGADTWRCKECHGWDYQGADGAYGAGSHFTGFPGVFGSSLSVEAMIAQIGGQTDPEHDFSVMGDQALADLAAFISGALEDPSPFIADDKSIVGGDAENGGALFAGTCAACHGADGTTLNFGDEDEPEFVGTIAQDNPWEFVHKVRFGQPGAPMPSAITSGWSLQDVVDIAAYAQTLPAEPPAEVDAAVQGGVLYDKWWAVLGMEAPAGDNPLWARQATNERSGADTWRCKECHGWDYQGADGAYGAGSHFTGFPGVFGSSLSVEAMIAQIGGQTDPEHDFSVMGDEAMASLAAFIYGALEDPSPFIADDKSIVGADLANGEALYTQVCAACHGDDGTTLNFGDEEEPEFVGTIAVDNPWEFAHKVRFGQPGTGMPATLTLGWSLQAVFDLAAYAQTLPTGG